MAVFEEKPVQGRVYDIQGFSVHDGPGIRTTVFLKGCPLRCPWCHSPESQKFEKQLIYIDMRCIGVEECGKCASTCKQGAVSVNDMPRESVTGADVRTIQIDHALCNDCGACAEVCYPEALYICGKDYTPAEIVERASRDKAFFDRSGGGITISGGEPLCQHEFVRQVFTKLKAMDINTALDTTGFASWDVIQELLPVTDLFLYDLKHMDTALHESVVKVPNEPILKNAKQIAENGGRLRIRIPLIPRFNDDEENLMHTAAFCCELGEALECVQLLPYHNLGVMKYQRIANDARPLEAVPHKEEQIERIKALFLQHDLPVIVH